MGLLGELIYLPRPREIAEAEGFFSARSSERISIRNDLGVLFPVAERLRDSVARVTGASWRIGAGTAGETPRICLALDRAIGRAQGYRITIRPDGIELAGADAPGIFYAAATLAQIAGQAPGRIPCGAISDWPDYPVRGVMLDISRDKVPTMDTLRCFVDMAADMKINHLELYTEHTFAYREHREVWEQASPMTGEEILILDAYCRDRFIDLVPNQNSFGHMQRWLTLPRYRPLAECPDGFHWPWGGRSTGPFSLDPSQPGSLTLLAGLYDELLPYFSSRFFNVGCDETFDLGQGRSRELCAKRGKGRVYLDFLLKVHGLVQERDRTMLYWGDIIMQHPELVAELPADAIALEWGYEANHPFDEHGERFARAGVPWWVCPGTSSWNSLAGRTDNALENLRSAARAGLAHGATGYLNTDWGDDGHWQSFPISFLGFAAGAGYSWCHAACGGTDFSRELDAHVFHDRAGALGGVVRDLGNTYRCADGESFNGSPFFRVLQSKEGEAPPPALDSSALARARQWVNACARRIDEASMDRADSDLIRRELVLTADLLLLACDHAEYLHALKTDPTFVAHHARDLHRIIGAYRESWVARNRIGGLAESVARLEAILPRRS